MKQEKVITVAMEGVIYKICSTLDVLSLDAEMGHRFISA